MRDLPRLPSKTKRIADNYNLDIKNPNTKSEDSGDPIELLKEYEKICVEVEQTREALKQELMDALGRGIRP